MNHAIRTESGKWRIRVVERTDPDGTRHYKSFTAPKKREAEAQAIAFMASLPPVQEHAKEMKPLSKPFKTILSDYISAKDKILSPSTLTEYKAVLRRGTELDDIPVSKINQKTLQNCVNSFSATHSPKSTRNFYSLIITALKFDNPGFNVHIDLPPKQAITYHIPTEAEVKKMIATATGELKIAIMLATFCPARRSEVCAIKYSDISKGVLHIHAAIVLDGRDYVYKPTTKSRAGDRFIPLPKEIIDLIGIGEPDEFIVKMQPYTLYNQFSRMCAKIGMHYRFHDLRHYGASMLHALGLPDAYIMQRGGWDNNETLQNIYLHTLPEHSDKFNKLANEHFTDFLH